MVDMQLFATRTGRFVETPVGGEMVRAFVPPALPPDPPIDILSLLPKLSAPLVTIEPAVKAPLIMAEAAETAFVIVALAAVRALVIVALAAVRGVKNLEVAPISATGLPLQVKRCLPY